jgi:two-component system sensor kinase
MAARLHIEVRPPLVGWHDEVAALWDQFEASLSGRAHVVLIAGEPGIGKTRLLDAFAERATGEGAALLRTAAIVGRTFE